MTAPLITNGRGSLRAEFKDCSHQDCGCRFGATCCLECPLQRCIFDTWLQQGGSHARD